MVSAASDVCAKVLLVCCVVYSFRVCLDLVNILGKGEIGGEGEGKGRAKGRGRGGEGAGERGTVEGGEEERGKGTG